MGMVKKVLLADSIALYADSVSNAAEKAFPLSGGEAWLARCATPFSCILTFRATPTWPWVLASCWGPLSRKLRFAFTTTVGIVGFWRRWHITRSSWLRDFLYIPLAATVRGRFMQYRNLFLTMLIGGEGTALAGHLLYGCAARLDAEHQPLFPRVHQGQGARAHSGPCATAAVLHTIYVFLHQPVLGCVPHEGAGRMFKAMFISGRLRVKLWA